VDDTEERSVGVDKAARDLSHLQRVEVGQACCAPPWARPVTPLVSLRVEYGGRCRGGGRGRGEDHVWFEDRWMVAS
jgi:hypothetical protein